MMFADRSSEQLEGLTAFISRWEINDLLFMVMEENIRPEETVPGQPPLWFAITPDSWRVQLINASSPLLGGDPERVPFLLTRVLTMIAFAAIVFWLCRQVWNNPDAFAESAFLTVAWFWLLSPTQNPWYWTWALPLVQFYDFVVVWLAFCPFLLVLCWRWAFHRIVHRTY